MYALFGGRKPYIYRPARGNRKDCWRWYASGVRARGIALTLYGLLSLKRRAQIARALLALLGTLLIAAPASSQVLDPEPFAPWRIAYQQQHIAAGAALDVVAQLPILPRGMRDTPLKRVLLVTFVGIAYEAGEEAIARDRGIRGNGFGFGLADLACNLLGALAAETVAGALR